MSRLVTEWFDFFPISSPVAGTIDEDTTHQRSGHGCGVAPSGGFNIVEPRITEVTDRTFFYRFAFAVDVLPSATVAIARFRDPTGDILEVALSKTGKVELWNPVDAVHPPGSVFVAAGDYVVVEIALRIPEVGDGLLSWRADGVELASDEAMGFRNDGVARVRLGNPGAAASGSIVFLDDIAINDDQGATDNTWVGVDPDPVPAILPRYWGGFIAPTREDNLEVEKAPYDPDEVLLNEFEADSGKLAGIIHLGDPFKSDPEDEDFPDHPLGPVWDGYFPEGRTSEVVHQHGSIMMKDVGGPANVIQDTIAGVYDDGWRDWAEKARDYAHPFFLRIFWEFNGYWFPWGRDDCTPEEFIAAWRHIVDLITEVGATNVTMVWCTNAIFVVDDPFGGEGSLCGDRYPGDDYVDWIGVDGYTGQNPHLELGFRNSKSIFAETYERCQEEAPDKPMILCEFSASEWKVKGGGPAPPAKAEWLRQLLEWTGPVDFPNLRAYVIFNWLIFEGGGLIDWPFQTTPSSTAAVRGALEDEHWVDPPVRYFEDLTKVPLPGAVKGGTYEDGTYGSGTYGDPAIGLNVAVTRDVPPSRHTVIVRAPDRTPLARWSDDEESPANTLTDLECSGGVPGGKKELRVELPRNPRQDWPDLDGFLNIECQLDGRTRIWDGRIGKAPRSDGDRMVINGEAVGWAAALEDRKALRFGFIDPDLNKWGEPTAARRQALKTAAIALVASTSTGFSSLDPLAVAAAVLNDFDNVTVEEGKTPAGEADYDSGGVDIGKVLYDFRELSSVGASALWETLMALGTTDTFATAEPGSDHNATTALEQSVEAPGPGFRFARLRDRLVGGTSGAPLERVFAWQNLKVISRLAMEHDLGLQGEWPAVGFTAAQMLKVAVPEFSGLRATDESVEDDRFVIQDAWPSDPGTLARFVDEVLKFGLMDWFVKDLKLFEVRRPGTYGRRWQAYQGPSNFEEAGTDTERCWDRIVVAYQDGGVTRYVGYPGSGADVETEQLQITDPDHPAVRAGEPREDLLVIDSLSTATRAIEAGERWLQDANELSRSGRAELTGFVEDENRVLHPVGVVAEGDLIRFPDARDASYRKIADYSYNPKTQKVSIGIDAPSESVKALLERYRAVLVSVGLAR